MSRSTTCVWQGLGTRATISSPASGFAGEPRRMRPFDMSDAKTSSPRVDFIVKRRTFATMGRTVVPARPSE